MEIKQLRWFRTVVEAGGLTKAAGLLRVTPGTLSKAIRVFEDDLGKSLFRRVGRSLALTQDGERLYHMSAPLIEEHHRLLRSLDSSRPAPRPMIRVASFEVFTTHCLGAADLGDVALDVLEVRPGAIEKAVAAHEVEVGITYAPDPSVETRHERIATIEFGIFARRGAFRRHAVAELPFAIPTSPLLLHSQDILAIDCWPYERVPRVVKYRLTSLESALELTRRGRCVVFIPLFIAGLHNATVRRQLQLRRIPNPPRLRPVRRDVHVVARDENGPAACTVAHAIAGAIATGEASL
jgi:DNA-binding transcriptional LysR family regulator